MYVIPDVRTTMFVAGGVATEKTTALFISGASAKEVQILSEGGQAVPAYGEDFFIAYKDVNGTYLRTNTIKPGNIKSATVTSAITPIPTYSYFDVDITGMAAGDEIQTMVQVYGFGTSSWHQRLNRVISEKFVTSDTSVALGARLGIKIQENLARTFESKPATTVYNKAGYKAVYETEAAAEAAIGDLTDGQLVWVIANSAAYTVAKSGGTAFADDFTLKTDWSAEIAATTAEVVQACKYFDVVQLDSTSDRLFIICKVLSQDDRRKFGYESPVYVGAQWLDASNKDVKTDIGVTHVAERLNPGDGKHIRNMEVALDTIHRPYGKFAKMGESPVLASDTTVSYTVLNLVYKMADGNTPHQLSVGNDNYHTLQIAFTSSVDAANFLAAIVLTYNLDSPAEVDAKIAAITLNDLADVVIASGQTGDIIQLAGDKKWKNVVSDT